MLHVLTRRQLHDMVWERAVSKVPPELGISDVALREQCVKHAIIWFPVREYFRPGSRIKAKDFPIGKFLVANVPYLAAFVPSS